MGQGEVGGVHLKGANSMAVSGLGHEEPWLEPGRPFLLSVNVPRRHLVLQFQ